MSEKKKVVLAYSGGLDTTFCLHHLKDDKNLEVHTVLVDTGGFSQEELVSTEAKALSFGAKAHKNIAVVDEFYEKAIKYLIFGNVLRNNTYPLSVSAERVFQAIAIAEYANEVKADYIAHGSTGAGNDQVRFDLIFQIMCPDKEIITPIRDLQLSRQDEIDYLKEKGVNLEWEKAKYSINKGIWGTSVGGAETLTSDQYLPNAAFPSQNKQMEHETHSLLFEKGELVGIDHKKATPIECIQKLQKIAEKFAIGRDIHVGDTIIGLKGRVGFEAAAPLIIIKAHHLLEKHTLTKWQQHWKEQLGSWYGMMLHEAQYLDPVMRHIEKFLEDSQQTVSGEVIVKMEPYHFTLQGINSEHDLMSNKFGVYGEMNSGWSGEDVRSFTKIMANQVKMFHQVNQTEL